MSAKPRIWTPVGLGTHGTPMIGGPFVNEDEEVRVVEAQPVAELLERWSRMGEAWTREELWVLVAQTEALLTALRKHESPPEA